MKENLCNLNLKLEKNSLIGVVEAIRNVINKRSQVFTKLQHLLVNTVVVTAVYVNERREKS